MSERNPELPIVTACPGGCGEWLEEGDGVVIGQQELGTGLGFYAEVRLCNGCAAKRQGARRTSKIETKAAKKA